MLFSLSDVCESTQKASLFFRQCSVVLNTPISIYANNTASVVDEEKAHTIQMMILEKHTHQENDQELQDVIPFLPSFSQEHIRLVIDLDSVLYGAQSQSSPRNESIRVNFQNVTKLVEFNRFVYSRGLLVSSRRVFLDESIRKEWKTLRYNFYTPKEYFVIRNELVRNASGFANPTCVFLSGQGKYMDMIQSLLEAGWKVEIWIWSSDDQTNYQQALLRFPDQVKLLFFDNQRNYVSYLLLK
jgi:hypothetical protein